MDPWTFLGQNTEVGSLSLLQGIFPSQGLNPGFPHCMRDHHNSCTRVAGIALREALAQSFRCGLWLLRVWVAVAEASGVLLGWPHAMKDAQHSDVRVLGNNRRPSGAWQLHQTLSLGCRRWLLGDPRQLCSSAKSLVMAPRRRVRRSW